MYWVYKYQDYDNFMEGYYLYIKYVCRYFLIKMTRMTDFDLLKTMEVVPGQSSYMFDLQRSSKFFTHYMYNCFPWWSGRFEFEFSLKFCWAKIQIQTTKENNYTCSEWKTLMTSGGQTCRNFDLGPLPSSSGGRNLSF